MNCTSGFESWVALFSLDNLKVPWNWRVVEEAAPISYPLNFDDSSVVHVSSVVAIEFFLRFGDRFPQLARRMRKSDLDVFELKYLVWNHGVEEIGTAAIRHDIIWRLVTRSQQKNEQRLGKVRL